VGKASDRANPQAARVGKAPGRVNPEAARVGKAPDRANPEAARVGKAPDRANPQAARVGSAPGRVNPEAARVGQAPGRANPEAPRRRTIKPHNPSRLQSPIPAAKPAKPSPSTGEPKCETLMPVDADGAPGAVVSRTIGGCWGKTF
jgi:hypothetical protein